MSGYGNPLRGSRKVELNDDYWVVLKHLRLGESDALNDKYTGDDQSSRKKAGKEGLLLAIHDWNLDDEQGDKWPIDLEHLDMLTQEDFIKISEVFAEMEGMTEEIEKVKEQARVKARAQFPRMADGSDIDRGPGATGNTGFPGAPELQDQGSPVGETRTVS